MRSALSVVTIRGPDVSASGRRGARAHRHPVAVARRALLADLARACTTTPQAMNGVLATLERESLIERRPHPTHGWILQATLTSEGQRRLEAANPAVRSLRRTIERGFSSDEIATVKTWLVATAQRLERTTEARAA